MVVDDLDVSRSQIRPDKADPVLIVDPNAVLARAALLECLQTVGGRHAEIVELPCGVQELKLSPGDPPEAPRADLPSPFGPLP